MGSLCRIKWSNFYEYDKFFVYVLVYFIFKVISVPEKKFIDNEGVKLLRAPRRLGARRRSNTKSTLE